MSEGAHDSVTLKGMRFHTRIGVLPHEAELAQPLEVDLTVRVASREGQRGSTGIVDYRELYAVVGQVLGEGHIHYLEDVGARIASLALGLAGVVGARVAVRKPNVALQGPLDYAEVVVERSQD